MIGRFGLACAPVLARVAGFGEDVVPLLGLWIGRGFREAASQFVECFWEDWRLSRFRVLGDGGLHRLIPRRWGARVFCVRLVVKPVSPGEVAFGDQFRLGGQPMLHVLSGRRTLVHIGEVGPSGHFIAGRRKINCALVEFPGCGRSRWGGDPLVLFLGDSFVIHRLKIAVEWCDRHKVFTPANGSVQTPAATS